MSAHVAQTIQGAYALRHGKSLESSGHRDRDLGNIGARQNVRSLGPALPPRFQFLEVLFSLPHD
jgi:hypothetical protein